MNTCTAITPCDVLLDGKLPSGPELSASQAGTEYMAIYGFSGKESYDRFRSNGDRELIPYPLVKGYLKNQIADSDGVTGLVVLDAAGPQETPLHAATMESVLEAVLKKVSEVAPAYRLILDSGSDAYRVEKL